jgi:Cu/Ag efflux protein CusF
MRKSPRQVECCAALGPESQGETAFSPFDLLIWLDCERNRDEWCHAAFTFLFEIHEAVYLIAFVAAWEPTRCPAICSSFSPEVPMKIAKMIFATAAVAMTGSTAMAQQAVNGSITKVDEANGKITIQQTQSGTVGATTGGAGEDFKAQDGLMFNAFQVGDKVVFTATEIDGVKTITRLQKQ